MRDPSGLERGLKPYGSYGLDSISMVSLGSFGARDYGTSVGQWMLSD